MDANQAPGPRGHFLLGSLRERQRDPLRLFEQAGREHGAIVRFRFGPLRVFLINDPEGIRHVLQENAKNYVKGLGYDKLQMLLGNGLLTSEGDFWRRQRRLAQPAFHRQQVQGFAKTMSEVARATASRWGTRSPGTAQTEPVEILTEMMQIAYLIVSNTLFTSQLAEDAATVRKSLDLLGEEANRAIVSLFNIPRLIPTPRNRRILRAIEEMDRVVFKMIGERRRDPASHADLLSMLMAAQDEGTGIGMTDRQLRDEIMTLFTAGHETTAMALTWTLYLLAENPEIQERLAEGKDGPLLSQVIQESLRLYPPAWILSRRSLENDVVGGYRIKKGTILLISPWVMHRNEKFWPEPHRFDPTRFSPEKEAIRPRFSYIPFGAGARQCIGNGFALLEMQTVLSTLVSGFRFKLKPDHPIVPYPLVTLRPKFGMPLLVEPRS